MKKPREGSRPCDPSFLKENMMLGRTTKLRRLVAHDVRGARGSDFAYPNKKQAKDHRLPSDPAAAGRALPIILNSSHESHR